MIARRVVVSGRVQGVGFRWSTRTQAQALGIVGWVRNRVDGSVEAVFEGDAAAVASRVEWARRGPAMAHVESLQEAEIEPGGHAGFEVRA